MGSKNVEDQVESCTCATRAIARADKRSDKKMISRRIIAMYIYYLYDNAKDGICMLYVESNIGSHSLSKAGIFINHSAN